MADKTSDLEFNKSLVRRFLEVAVSKPDFDLFDELCGIDYVWHGDAGPTEKNEVRGLENFKVAVADFTKALPDLKVTIEDIMAADDKVIVRIRERGTHTGAPFAGIQPSGNTVEWACIGIYRIEDRKIVEEWFNEDSLGILRQLGGL